MRIVMMAAAIGVSVLWGFTGSRGSGSVYSVGEVEADAILGGDCFSSNSKSDYCAQVHLETGPLKCTYDNKGCNNNNSVPLTVDDNNGVKGAILPCLDEPSCTYPGLGTVSCSSS